MSVSGASCIRQANKATEVPPNKASIRGDVNSLLLLEPFDPLTTKVHCDSLNCMIDILFETGG